MQMQVLQEPLKIRAMGLMLDSTALIGCDLKFDQEISYSL